MKPFIGLRHLLTLQQASSSHPHQIPPILLGLCVGLLIAPLSRIPALAQTPQSADSADMGTERSPEQETPSTNNPAPGDRSSAARTIQLGLLPFVPPPEEPAPQNTLGGGRRNSQCIAAAELSADTTNSSQIAALAPPPQVIGLTEREKPTVWLHQPIPSVRQILLSVREENSQQFHSQTTIAVSPDRQWIPLRLSDDAPPLEPDINYLWAAITMCGDAPGPNDPALSTRIRRVASPSSHSAGETPLALAEGYARQGLWYDAVDALVQAQSANGEEDLTETWQALLDYAELSSVAPPLSLPTSE